MKKEEYIETIVFNGHIINIGIDDYGQTYFLEYVDNNGKLVEDCVGPYESDYMSYIEHIFGVPALNCDIINNVDNECERVDKMYCHKCCYNPSVIARDKRWLESYGAPYPQMPQKELKDRNQ